MSLVEELIKELESDPEKAKKLLEKMAELYPEFSLSLQVRKLVEQMGLMAEEQTKIWQEIRAIKEEQTKIWQEIKAIKEEQTKIWQEIREMIEVIKELQIRQDRLERKMDHIYEGLSASIMYAFGELGKYAGMAFEEFVRKFLTDRMRRAGEIPADKELKPVVVEGEEIDAFLEDPLIIVEITAHAKSPEKIEKLLRKAEKIRKAYGKEPRKILIVQTADKDVAKELRRIAESEDVELIVGRIL